MPTYPIVGAHFRPPAQALLQILPAGAKLQLRREPENQFDPNAIAVWMPTSSIPDAVAEELDTIAQTYGHSIDTIYQEEWHHLGYIPAKGGANILAPLWDANAMRVCDGTMAFNATGAPRIAIDGPWAGPGMGSGAV